MASSKDNRKMQDMSVDEILKSIRKIIEKSGTSKEKVKLKDSGQPVQLEAQGEDILELTNIVDTTKQDQALLSEQAASEASCLLKNFAGEAETAVRNTLNKSRTLEELVIEMIKPELKEWLNDNLPTLVKSLVEKEIKKLIPNSTIDKT